MKIEKINKAINNLEFKISEEGSSVTTFTYSDYTINYIDELVKYNQISKQKLYEMIISDEYFLKNIIKNWKPIKSRNNQKIQVKQRVSKKSLLILNSISQKVNSSRDYLMEQSIQILHENLNRKIKDNLNVLTDVSDVWLLCVAFLQIFIVFHQRAEPPVTCTSGLAVQNLHVYAGQLFRTLCSMRDNLSEP